MNFWIIFITLALSNLSTVWLVRAAGRYTTVKEWRLILLLSNVLAFGWAILSSALP